MGFHVPRFSAALHRELQITLLQLVVSLPSNVQTLQLIFHVVGPSRGKASLLIRQETWLHLAHLLCGGAVRLRVLEFILVATVDDLHMGLEEWQWSDDCIKYVQDIFSSVPGMLCPSREESLLILALQVGLLLSALVLSGLDNLTAVTSGIPSTLYNIRILQSRIEEVLYCVLGYWVTN